jgi:hypothetical protein
MKKLNKNQKEVNFRHSNSRLENCNHCLAITFNSGYYWCDLLNCKTNLNNVCDSIELYEDENGKVCEKGLF